MEQPVQSAEAETPSSESESTIGRRQLLKALAGGGLAVAFTNLPGQWTAPRAEVGTLPIHAQVSGVSYSGLCDSTPGGGDLRITEGSIRDIRPRLVVRRGTAPIEGIRATMNVMADPGTHLTFDPALPQSSVTDAAGIAEFSDLMVTGNPNDAFSLVFTFAAPTEDVHLECGVFFFGTTALNQ